VRVRAKTRSKIARQLSRHIPEGHPSRHDDSTKLAPEKRLLISIFPSLVFPALQLLLFFRSSLDEVGGVFRAIFSSILNLLIRKKTTTSRQGGTHLYESRVEAATIADGKCVLLEAG
jgi:hypothetical protein